MKAHMSLTDLTNKGCLLAIIDNSNPEAPIIIQRGWGEDEASALAACRSAQIREYALSLEKAYSAGIDDDSLAALMNDNALALNSLLKDERAFFEGMGFEIATIYL